MDCPAQMRRRTNSRKRVSEQANLRKRTQGRAESRRPAEGAMTGGSTALSRTNPAQMTRAQREAIARRVLKGERVLL